MEKLPKIISILGVTASGKTSLAMDLAKKFNGEVVSADSRQVYKAFDIGTAKPDGHWMHLEGQRTFMVGFVPHHLIDIIDPKEDFTLSDYKTAAIQKIDDVLARSKLPFLVGGTALYLKAVLENLGMPQVKPDIALRRKLEHKNPDDLYGELKKRDPEAANITGPYNKRRIIRALEVIYQTAKKFSEQRKKGPLLFKALKIGLTVPKDELKNRISQRTNEMVKNGLVEEVRRLHKKYPWSLVPMQSIDYQEFKEYFDGKKGLSETITLINQHHLAYAKRQMTWFKKDKDIYWVPADPKLALAESAKLVQDFLAK